MTRADSDLITVKQVGDTLIASLRFRGEYDETPQCFQQLYEQVKPYVTGKGIVGQPVRVDVLKSVL